MPFVENVDRPALPKTQDLLREFATGTDDKQRPKQAGWLDGVKNFIDSLTD